jgi:hypothetical protein
VTDGHGVSSDHTSPRLPVNTYEQHAHEILTEIAAGEVRSQRSLSSKLGIALGLTNLLIRRLVRKGCVRVIQIRPNRVRYLLTPAGIAEKARISQLYLQHSLRFYADARARVHERLTALAAVSPPVADDALPAAGERRIVFFGTGEVAEIAYICLQQTDAKLVAVVGDDSRRTARFFGVPVFSSEELSNGLVGTVAFDFLLVTALDKRDGIRATLAARRISPDRVHWL